MESDWESWVHGGGNGLDYGPDPAEVGQRLEEGELSHGWYHLRAHWLLWRHTHSNIRGTLPEQFSLSSFHRMPRDPAQPHVSRTFASKSRPPSYVAHPSLSAASSSSPDPPLLFACSSLSPPPHLIA